MQSSLERLTNTYDKGKKWLTCTAILATALVALQGCKDKPNGPDTPTNNALSVSVQAPSNLDVPAEAEIRYSLSDADGLVSADLTGNFPNAEGNYNITRNFSSNTPNWDTTITRQVGLAGQGSFDIIATSNTPQATENKAASTNTTYTQKETDVTQFSSVFSSVREGEQTEYLLRANDADKFRSAVHKEVFPSAPNDTVTTQFDASETTFEQSLHKTFDQEGTYFSRLEMTDTNGNVQIDENSVHVLAPLVQRTFSIHTPYQGLQTTLELDFNNQQTNAVTDENGKATLSINAPRDSTIAYSGNIDALGIQESTFSGVSSADDEQTVAIQPVPITIGNSLPGQYPGEETVHDLSDLVTATDTEGEVPTILSFAYTGNNFITSNDGSVYTFTPTKNEAGVTEEFTLTVTAPYSQQQETIQKEIFNPRSITIDDAFPSGTENSDLVLEEFDDNYVQSEAQIDSVNVSTNDPNIVVSRSGDTFTITPEKGFFGNATIIGYARNIDGAQKSEQKTLNFESLPKANITAINSVTNQAVQSYLLFRDANEAVLDSIVSNNGQFEVAIPENAAGLSVAEQINGVVKSFEHYIPINPAQDITKTLAVEDFRNYDIDRNLVGEMSLFDMKRFKMLINLVHGKASYIPLGGQSNGGGFDEILHRATESANGIGYDALIIPDTTDWITFGEIGIMGPGTPDLIENEYLTKIAPIMGNFAIPVQRKERIEYINDQQTPNVAYINPRELPDSFGTIVVFGKLPYINQQSLAQIVSDGDGILSDEGNKRTSLQELTNGLIYFSQLQADFGGSKGIPTQYQLRRDESIIHNNTNRLDLSKFDRKAGWMIYEPHHVPGEKIDNILWVPSQVKAEYDGS